MLRPPWRHCVVALPFRAQVSASGGDGGRHDAVHQVEHLALERRDGRARWRPRRSAGRVARRPRRWSGAAGEGERDDPGRRDARAGATRVPLSSTLRDLSNKFATACQAFVRRSAAPPRFIAAVADHRGRTACADGGEGRRALTAVACAGSGPQRPSRRAAVRIPAVRQGCSGRSQHVLRPQERPRRGSRCPR